MEHFNPILGYETTGPKFITCGEIMLRLTPPNYEKLRISILSIAAAVQRL